jgi:hypothetical protein
VITKVLTDASGQTGVYYDEGGHPMQGSALVGDPKFQDRVVAETPSSRKFGAATPATFSSVALGSMRSIRLAVSLAPQRLRYAFAVPLGTHA